MKLPHVNFKAKVKFKFNLNYVINPLLIFVILIELYFVYASLYKNLNPQATEVVVNKIVKVDPTAYQDTADLIQARQSFTPNLSELQNQSPFKYNQ